MYNCFTGPTGPKGTNPIVLCDLTATSASARRNGELPSPCRLVLTLQDFSILTERLPEIKNEFSTQFLKNPTTPAISQRAHKTHRPALLLPLPLGETSTTILFISLKMNTKFGIIRPKNLNCSAQFCLGVLTRKQCLPVIVTFCRTQNSIIC